jgi:hypothetical protein
MTTRTQPPGIKVELSQYAWLYRGLRRIFTARPAIAGFVVLFGLLAAWSLATPEFAAPDEPAQVVKAVATVRGQLIGSPVPALGKAYTQVHIPATFDNAYIIPKCFAFFSAKPAGCGPQLHVQPGTATMQTYVGRYPPLYYLVVGLPSWLHRAGADLYLMRLFSAAGTALFLVGAFVSAARSRRARLLIPGVALAVTPTVLFLGSVVNASGWEISAAACVWASGLVYFGEPERRDRWLLIRLAISAAVMVQLRGLSPFLLAIIAVYLGFVAGWRQLRELARRRDVQVASGIIGAFAIFAVVWIVVVDSLSVTKAAYQVAPSVSDWAVFKTSVRLALDLFHQMVGLFGWNDTTAPNFVNYIWLVLVAGLVLAGLIQREWRKGLLLASLCVVVIAFPTALTFTQARSLGYVGQARYVMPLVVGVPILAGYLAPERPRFVRPAVLVAGLALVVAQAATFVHVLHRYRTGIGTSLFSTNGKFAPPISTIAVLAIFSVMAICYWLWWSTLAAVSDDRDVVG